MGYYLKNTSTGLVEYGPYQTYSDAMEQASDVYAYESSFKIVKKSGAIKKRTKKRSVAMVSFISRLGKVFTKKFKSKSSAARAVAGWRSKKGKVKKVF